MSPEEKLLGGFRLFQLSCEMARAGIRSQSPELDEQGVERELQRRLDLQRRMDERDLYHPLAVEDGEASP